MNFNFLLSVRKTDFNFSVIYTQTHITDNVGGYWWFLKLWHSMVQAMKIYWKMIGNYYRPLEVTITEKSSNMNLSVR